MIYLLEDDEAIRRFVLYALNSTGMQAQGFEAPSQFWAQLKIKKPSLVLLDIMLPEEDGISVLKKLRSHSETSDIPVIMLTAKSSEYDTVIGLDAGADDYIAKPFGTMELISRIKAVMRRTKAVEEEQTYVNGELCFCNKKHLVRVGGEDVALTFKEFELLSLLIKQEGTVLTRDQLLISIWGYDYDGENRTVDVHINSLRQKLKQCGCLIETVRGVGYKLHERA